MALAILAASGTDRNRPFAARLPDRSQVARVEMKREKFNS
jgi:hypothetical protein